MVRICFSPCLHVVVRLNMPPPSDPQQRQGISSRLDSLVKNPSTMPPKRISMVRAQPVSAPVSPASRLQHLAEDARQPASPSQHSSGSPILRWFQSQMSSSSPSSPSPSRPLTPHSAALLEAMHNHLPTRPDPAHLPSQYHANIRPPMLDELTRSTLPTSSLTAPQPSESPADRLGHHTPDSVHPLLVNRIPPSAPARTSLDTLRTLYTKATPTVSSHQQTRSITIPTPFRSWFQTESGDKHSSILTDEDQDEDSEVERENIRKKCKYSAHLMHRLPSLNALPDLSPKNPVVFCHGLLGFDSVSIGPAIAPLEVTHWRGIKEVLQFNGVDVLITRVPATSSPIDRAQVLAKRISEVYPGQKIHLIGLSLPILCRDGLCIYTQALV